MKRSQAFEGTFLRTEDLDGKEFDLIIDKAAMAEINNPETRRVELKPVLYFVDRKKGMILNHTNWDTLEEAYGAESDHWHGRPVILYPTTTRFGSSTVPCMRIRVPKASSAEEAPPPCDEDAPPEAVAESAPF